MQTDQALKIGGCRARATLSTSARSETLRIGLALLLVVVGRLFSADAQVVEFQQLEEGKVIRALPSGAVPVASPGGPPPGQPPVQPPQDQKPPEQENSPEGEPPKAAESEAPKNIRRSEFHMSTTNPDAFKVRPDEEGMIQFQFDGAPWPMLIDWLADVTDMAVDWQELPGDLVNLRTQRRYTLDETRDMVNRHLLARGFTLLQEGELLTVVKTEQINLALVPRVTLEELETRQPHDFVKISFQLDDLLAEQAVKELGSMVSKNGKLTALTTTNRIEAVDAARNLQQIARVLHEEQSADRRHRSLREFPLEYVRAAMVQSKLKELLGIENKQNAMPMNPEQQQMMMQMQQQMQQQQQQQEGQPGMLGPRQDAKVMVVINEQRNSVLVQAPPDKMVLIEEAVRLLDVPDQRRTSLDALVAGIRPYRLETLDPQEVVHILLETGGLDPETRLTIDEKSASIIVSGPPWDHLTVEKLISKLDGSPRQFKVVRLRRRYADQVATTIENLMVGPKEDNQRNRGYYGWWDQRNENDEKKDQFRVAADVEHNWLLLWCNDGEYERVQTLLAEMGEIAPRQSNANTVRVLDAMDPAEVDRLLERAREAFRHYAPNKVILPEPADSTNEPPASDPPADDVKEEPAADSQGDESAVTSVDRSTTEPVERPRMNQVANGTELWAAGPTNHLIAQLESRPAPQFEGPAGQDNPDDATSASPPEIRVSRMPDGRIILNSTDTKALDLLEELLLEMRPRDKDFVVFKLEYASAVWVSLQLEDFFEEEDDSDRNRFPFFFIFDEQQEEDSRLGLADRRPIRFISEIDTNTIVVRNATEEQLRTVKELIELYDIPEPVNSQTARHTRLIHIKHSKASIVATQIKDAFRDLLSGNDKAFQQQVPQEQQRSRPDEGMMSFGFDNGDGESRTESNTRASFKGKLSIGIDDTTNTLLVSTEGETLMNVIVAMIEELDESAKPSDNVRVVRLKSHTSTHDLRAALSRMFDENGTEPSAPRDASRSEAQAPGDQAAPGPQNPKAVEAAVAPAE